MYILNENNMTDKVQTSGVARVKSIYPAINMGQQ